jgi:hypothetical protein
MLRGDKMEFKVVAVSSEEYICVGEGAIPPSKSDCGGFGVNECD